MAEETPELRSFASAGDGMHGTVTAFAADEKLFGGRLVVWETLLPEGGDGGVCGVHGR